MSLIQVLRKPRPIHLLLVFVLLSIVYWLLGSTKEDSFTPEELNSLLQNKDEDVNIKKVELTAQGISQPYYDANTFKMSNFDVFGNPVIKNTEFIRLTSDNPHQAGMIYSKLPIQAESFEMEVTFHIHNKAGNKLSADGFAIWFTDEKSDLGDVFGARNYFTGLGIFIDTFRNGLRGNFPYVNLMLGDGNTKYNKGNDGQDTRLAGCSAKQLLNPSSGVTKARIVYIKNGYFSLDFNYNGNHEEWSNCVTLNNVILPSIKYLGFSAETGDLSENVDLIENKVFALYSPDGGFIKSVEELETIVENQDDADTQEKATKNTRSGKRKRMKSSRRRTVSRLRKAEKRIKEREKKLRLEKYGDENARFYTYPLKVFLKGVKLTIYSLILLTLVWLGYILYRSWKQGRKSKLVGLLD